VGYIFAALRTEKEMKKLSTLNSQLETESQCQSQCRRPISNSQKPLAPILSFIMSRSSLGGLRELGGRRGITRSLSPSAFHFPPKILWLLMFMCFIVMGPVSQGAEKYFAADKIKPGMKGEALTVFQGTKIEKFEVKVIAVVAGEFENEELILVRLGGKAIEACGGLAAGMSGSPVYFRGKLAGAISYGFENADPFLAYVTPIATMRKLLDNHKRLAYVTYYRKREMIPVNTPVIVSGMGTRGFNLLSRPLREFGLTPVFLPASGGRGAGVKGDYEIKPGGAIAVQLVSGDYCASAIGTVTMVEGKDFLAFGHPFTNRGDIDLLAYKAVIHHIVKSPVISMKIGTPLNPIGRIFTDRRSGIAGKLGEFPEMIAVRMNVKDLERNTEQISNFQVINDEQLYRDLITNVATAAFDRAIDRVGSGAAKVAFTINCQDAGQSFKRENLFYNKDIAVAALKELSDVLNAYATNEFAVSALRSVQINIEIDNRNNSAGLRRLEVDKTKIKPGESVAVKAWIHPFRGQDTAVTFEVAFPETITPGKFILTVRGGSENPSETKDNNGKKTSTAVKKEVIGSFDELLTSLSRKPKNNELVLEYSAAEPHANPGENRPDQSGPPVRMKAATGYYMAGEAKVVIEVEKR
jgi:hypothetical protein